MDTYRSAVLLREPRKPSSAPLVAILLVAIGGLAAWMYFGRGGTQRPAPAAAANAQPIPSSAAPKRSAPPARPSARPVPPSRSQASEQPRTARRRNAPAARPPAAARSAEAARPQSDPRALVVAPAPDVPRTEQPVEPAAGDGGVYSSVDADVEPPVVVFPQQLGRLPRGIRHEDMAVIEVVVGPTGAVESVKALD